MAWGFQRKAPCSKNLQCPHTKGGKSLPRGDPQRFSQKFLHPDLAFSSARVGKPQSKIASVVTSHRNPKKKRQKCRF